MASNNAAARDMNPASVSDHSVSSMDSSSVVQQMSSQPTSPSTSTRTTTAPPPVAVAPQNPFEQVISSPPATVTISGGRRRPSAEPRPEILSPAADHSSSAPSSPQQQTRSPVSLTPRMEHNPPHPQSAPPPVSVPSLSRATDPPQVSSEQRHYPQQTTRSASLPTVQQPVFDDDETTEPSSAANTSNEHVVHPTGLTRFLEHTRRRLSSAGREDDDDEIMDGGALISGYLQKLGRNGKWQIRWFETDGECLSYYKSKKRAKLLATLDLEKVGAIEIDTDDSKGCSFTIQVLGRMYHLRADSRAACKDWVITLNRVKEARLHQGNVKLVNPHPRPFDLLDGSDDGVTPRVVVVANRQRTRAVAETQDWDQLIRVDPSEADVSTSSFEMRRRSAIGTVVLARWTKRRSSLSRLGQKLVLWARSLNRYRCTEIQREDPVLLDRYVHPPGHDDQGKRAPPSPIMESQKEITHEGLSGWVDKEISHSSGSDEGGPPVSPPQPHTRRTMSSSSDDIRQIS